jgi:hypothetical protein
MSEKCQEETHAPQQFVSLFARLFILPAAFGLDALRFHLALQLSFLLSSESMGNHDSEIVDADGVG